MNTLNKQEIDFILFFQLVWNKKKILIRISFLFLIIGIFLSLLLPVKYTTTTIFVPQINSSNKIGQFSSLAEIAGININAFDNSNTLSPITYPVIIKSLPFQYELIYTKIYLESIKDTVTLYDYYTKYYKNDLISSLFSLFRRKEITIDNKKNFKDIYILNRYEDQIIKLNSKNINIKIKEKEGYLILQVTMHDPYVAAQVALKSINLLQKYVTKYKIEKVQQQYLFTLQRFNEKKFEFEKIQKELAQFRDRNKNITAATVKIQEEEILNKYNIAYNVFMELAKQLEQVQIKVKEDTPVLTIIEPVKVPNKKSSPNRILIIALSLFIGFFSGFFFIIIKEIILKEIHSIN